MKTKEEILKMYLSDNYFAIKEQDLKPLILKAMEEFANQSKWVSVEERISIFRSKMGD